MAAIDLTNLGPDPRRWVEAVRNALESPADLRCIERPAMAVFYLEGMVREDRLFPLLKEAHENGVLQPVEGEADGARFLDEMRLGNALILRRAGTNIRIGRLPLPGWQMRPISEPVSETLIRGPREGFTETLPVNTAMIRRWIADPRLRVDEVRIGTRTKTPVRLIYLADVANPDLVREIKERLAAIAIDGILESGYLEQFIADNRWTLFPLLQSTERSDKVAAGILEGRVGILVDKSPFALIVPATVNELYQSPEDYYFHPMLGTFLRFFRLLGSNLAVAFSGLYVALASFNPELLPTNLAFAIAESRRGVPYPLLVEVLFLEIAVEIFREAGLRLPSNISQMLGIVAGTALTYAAVMAHLVSGTSVVVVAIGAVASFSAPNFSVSIPWRILKFVLILSAGALGIIGLTLAGVTILAHAATLSSFGTPYLAPWGPLQPYELRDAVTRVPLWLRYRRSETYHAAAKRRLAAGNRKGGKDGGP